MKAVELSCTWTPGAVIIAIVVVSFFLCILALILTEMVKQK